PALPSWWLSPAKFSSASPSQSPATWEPRQQRPRLTARPAPRAVRPRQAKSRTPRRHLLLATGGLRGAGGQAPSWGAQRLSSFLGARRRPPTVVAARLNRAALTRAQTAARTRASVLSVAVPEASP